MGEGWGHPGLIYSPLPPFSGWWKGRDLYITISIIVFMSIHVNNNNLCWRWVQRYQTKYILKGFITDFNRLISESHLFRNYLFSAWWLLLKLLSSDKCVTLSSWSFTEEGAMRSGKMLPDLCLAESCAWLCCHRSRLQGNLPRQQVSRVQAR